MVAGAVLLYLGFVLDCVDGQLARYTRHFSAFGGWLDTMADRAKEYVVYAGLAAGADRIGLPYAWPLAIAAIVLQTVRHMTDAWYGALHDEAAARPGGDRRRRRGRPAERGVQPGAGRHRLGGVLAQAHRGLPDRRAVGADRGAGGAVRRAGGAGRACWSGECSRSRTPWRCARCARPSMRVRVLTTVDTIAAPRRRPARPCACWAASARRSAAVALLAALAAVARWSPPVRAAGPVSAPVLAGARAGRRRCPRAAPHDGAAGLAGAGRAAGRRVSVRGRRRRWRFDVPPPVVYRAAVRARAAPLRPDRPDGEGRARTAAGAGPARLGRPDAGARRGGALAG